MKRCASVLTATMLLLGTAACASSGTDDPQPTASTSTSASSDGQTSADASQDELTSKIATDAPPEDVVWLRPDAPADWKTLEAEVGTQQWQVGDRCVVTTSQPQGVGSEQSPTTDEVADEQVRRMASSAKLEDVPAADKSTVMVPAQVKGLDGRVEQKFATRQFTTDQNATYLIWARRYGDFAMLASAACGGGDFDTTYDQEIKPFMESLAVSVTY